jgi:hypothetical protein
MKEYICADILINYFETEADAYARQAMFDSLFIDNYKPSMDDGILRTIISMAVSLQAKATLDCASKLIKQNLNKPNLQKLFKCLLHDQLGLSNASMIRSQLDTMHNVSLVFTASFINISLNFLLDEKLNDAVFLNFLKTLTIWLKSDSLVMLLLNENNFSIFLNLFNLAYIYPLDIISKPNQVDDRTHKLFADINLIFLKLIQRFTDDILQNIPNRSLIDLNYLNTIKAKFDLHPNPIFYKRAHQALELLIHKRLVDFDRDYLKRLFQSLQVTNGLQLDFFH